MKKKSVIIEWVISYIIVLMIPIVTIFINYFYNVQTINQEIYKSNELVLKNLANSIDEYFNEQKNFYAHVVTNTDLKSVVNREEKDAQFYFDVNIVYQQIKSYSQWRLPLSCLVYFSEHDYAIGQGGNSSYLYYQSMNRFSEEAEYLKWKDLVGGDYRNTFLVERYLDGKTEEQCIIYANSYLFSRSRKVNIFIGIPIAEIVAQMQFLDPNTRLLICLNNGTYLSVSSEGEVELNDDVDFMGVTEGTFETKEHMVVAKPAIEKSMVYYMMIPKRDFWEEQRFSRNMLLVSLSITLVVGWVCVSKLVKKNYRPLSNLYTKIINDMEGGNEFQQIENAYNKIYSEKGILAHKVTSMTEVMRDYYLLSIMKGQQCTVADVSVSLEPGESVILIVFLLSPSDELLFFAVENIFSELMEDEHFNLIRDGQHLFYLFQVEKRDGWREHCLEKINYLYEILKKGNQSMLAAVSDWETEITQIRNLYREVTEALEKKVAIGGTGVIDAKEWLKQNSIVNEVLNYIEMHYAENSLNINTIAEGISKNPKYISKVFKDETGGSILDYIHALRINEAKSILESGECSLEEVAEKVGYTNVMTFRRAFVKLTGVAPGKYKNG